MIETARLQLRPWQATDVAEFVRVTNTPEVMEFLNGVRDPALFHSSCLRQQASQAENGFCFWIVERSNDGALLGFCGLKLANVAPISNEIEIGWRLRLDAWGQGYAHEAATASLAFAWRNLSCRRVIAYTAQRNSRSRRLMERLGMERMSRLDFNDPDLPPDSPLRPHVVYAIARPT